MNSLFNFRLKYLEDVLRGFVPLFKKYNLISSDFDIENDINTYAYITLFTIIFFFIIFWNTKKIRKDVVQAILVDSSQPRFRKRDKVMFYGRKMLRKVKNSLQAKAKGKKRQLVLKFAKKMFRLKQNQPSTLQVKEPSQAFFEEIDDKIDPILPKEVIYMLKNIRVFGFFDQPLFLELCRHLEVLNVSRGQLFFSIGDDDDSIYIVQSGKLEVFTTEFDGSEIVLKEVAAGDSIVSLLSVLDVLSGHLAPFKTISSRAKEDSVVLRLQVKIFKNLLENYPESLVRIVQIIMVRLQRVTFTALHNYLGLTTQLVNYNKFKPGNSPTKANSLRSHKISVIHQLQILETLNSQEKSETIKEESAEHQPDNSKSNENSEINIKSSPTKQNFNSAHSERLKRKKSYLIEDKRANLPVEDLIQLAVDGFTSNLEVDDRSLILSMIQIKEFGPGEFVLKEDTYETSFVYYILSGSLVVSQKNIDSLEETNLYFAGPDEFVGVLEVITGEASAFTIRSKGNSKLASISKQNIYELIGKYPYVSLKLAHQVVKRLSPFVRQIDFALDWSHVESGRAIYRQKEPSDSSYIVLSGRVRSLITRSNGKKELISEHGRGDIFGIVEVLIQTKRSTTIIAVRDTELAKLPAGLLDFIKIKFPVVVTRLVHLLGHRILGSIQQKSPLTVAAESAFTRPTVSNFATVAILAINEDVPIHAFCLELKNALNQIDLTLLLNSSFLKKKFGNNAFDQSNEFRLSAWLAQQEDQHRVVLYQCDNVFSAWTKRCIRQADCILIVACADQRPTVGNVEKQLENLTVRTQKELILLHKENGEKPKNTVEWLNIRSWCSSHHHIRCPKKIFSMHTINKNQKFTETEPSPPNIHSDFSRLARFLTGKSIGLVLGGGGARGASHVGMLKAITEAGIPIDMVGGVSIGAFMGGLYCLENDIEVVRQKARNWAMIITSIWNQVLDLTYPNTAMFTGSSFNRTIYEVFGETTQIEDLWLPYFTVTTDITASCPRVHRNGSLWRYIRSSMSLSGYLPPLCDPFDGHLLLDGGYVNNLPADIMRDVMGAETILAVDVGSQDVMDFTNYGDQLNGWWLLLYRWIPFLTSKSLKVPSLPDIQSRLAYISCVRQLDEVKRSEYCTYIRPPIDKWKTLQFRNFDEIFETGLYHGRALFNSMVNKDKQDNNSLNSVLFKNKHKVFDQQGLKLPTRTSFTDLAEKVCKISEPNERYRFLSLSDCEEENDDYDSEEGTDCYNSEPEMSTEFKEEYSNLRERKVSTLF